MRTTLIRLAAALAVAIAGVAHAVPVYDVAPSPIPGIEALLVPLQDQQLSAGHLSGAKDRPGAAADEEIHPAIVALAILTILVDAAWSRDWRGYLRRRNTKRRHVGHPLLDRAD